MPSSSTCQVLNPLGEIDVQPKPAHKSALKVVCRKSYRRSKHECHTALGDIHCPAVQQEAPMRRAPAEALRALAEMPIAGFPPRLSTHPGRFLAVLRPPSRSSLTSNPHSAAAQPGPNVPRLRALALLGRLSAERAETLVIADIQKPAH